MNKISQMPQANPLVGTELLEVVQNGKNRSVAIGEIVVIGESVYEVV